MVGAINDMDWNAGGYDGLMRLEEEYGTEVSYVESLPQSDMGDALRNYAEAGYDIIFGHSGQFQDSILLVAESYPDTQFVCINGTEVRDNVTNIEVAENEQGYMMGVAAALLSETGTVGTIASVDIRPIRRSVEGFELGAKATDPDIEVLSAFTGSWFDAAKGKEIALSMIDNKADVIGNLAGIAGISIIEASNEQDTLAIGSGDAQHTVAPETVPVTVIRDLGRIFTFIYDLELNGNLEQTHYFLGTKEGAVYPIYPSGNVSQEIQDKLEEVKNAIASGEIVVP
jgi:basic membrane protein A